MKEFNELPEWHIKVKDNGTCSADYNFERARANYINIITWLENIKANGCNGVVLGLSGGKDSTVVAMLAKLVWGKDAIGIVMPNQSLEGVDDVQEIMLRLCIRGAIWPITEAYDYFKTSIYDTKALSNIAPRLRMTALYAQAQQLGYRVIGTGNRSERYIGWCTKHGDMACDFNPIAHLTCSEVIELGFLLADIFDLPYEFIQKPPADGITGKTDEENFGFTYNQLDTYLLKGSSGDPAVDKKIAKMHEAALHKLTMPATMEFDN
jgi:NAD+ synthase